MSNIDFTPGGVGCIAWLGDVASLMAQIDDLLPSLERYKKPVSDDAACRFFVEVATTLDTARRAFVCEPPYRHLCDLCTGLARNRNLLIQRPAAAQRMALETLGNLFEVVLKHKEEFLSPNENKISHRWRERAWAAMEVAES